MSALSAALLVASALFVSSCDDTTTTPTAFVPAAPSNLTALSVNDSTIRIMFTPSASESSTDFTGYSITATSGSSTKTFTVAKAGGTGTSIWVDVHPLESGKTWALALKATSKDSASSSITTSWATATRYTGLKAYERSSSLGSGINLVNGTQQTVAAGGSWDLCFDSDNGAYGAPGASAYVSGGQIGGSTPRKTYIFASDVDHFYAVTADSLNAVYEAKAINDTTSGRKLKIEGTVDVTTGTKSFALFVLTQDNNFAKILIKANGGKLIQSDANGKYVEIDASVQRTALVPYALRQALGFDKPGMTSMKILQARATN